MKSTLAAECAITKNPTAPASPTPPCAPSGSMRPKMPMGARRTTHRTNTSIASVTALKNPSSVGGATVGHFPIAIANKSVKRISGSIAPLAAAFTGLVGISDVSQLAKPTIGASDVSDCAASAAPGGSEGLTGIRCRSHAKRAIASGIMISVATASMLMKTASVFFFQAEDGIRDYKVTGVQTCALPIFRRHLDAKGTADLRDRAQVASRLRGIDVDAADDPEPAPLGDLPHDRGTDRSEQIGRASCRERV